MTIRGILFDKDGTLIAVNQTWVPVYRRLLADMFGADENGIDALMARAGYDALAASFRPGSILAAGTTRQLIDIWWPGLDAAGVAAKLRVIDHDYAPLARAALTPLMPLDPILLELRSLGLRLGIATNDTHTSARAHMDRLGITDHFENIIGADSVETPKPSGDMIRLFAACTGLAESEIAMVGDNSHDMEEARHGGAGLAIAVLSGNATHADIAHLADHTIASVADLATILRSL